MKSFFYPRLAWMGIRKNRRLYLPYILTCIGVTAVYYIIHYLATSNAFENMKGAGTLSTVLAFGFVIIGIFSLIFLFYTNSFLLRRRKKEFGLYNVLGMSKKNIARLMLCESVITGVISLSGGLALGIVLSKLCELFLSKMLSAPASYSFSVPLPSVLSTLGVYAAIYLFIFLSALRQLHLSKPAELLRSENVGEKPPRANWLLGILGLLLLVTAYIIAVSIKQPLAAILWFFIAVVMVIVASYMIFISGSVLVCRVLQKNKSFYYKARNFVSVSSMAYRMKRNGAGLASICILATMVLVTLSSTSCLYFGKEDSLDKLHPYDFTVGLSYKLTEDMKAEGQDEAREAVRSLIEAQGKITDSIEFKSLSVAGEIINGAVDIDPEEESGLALGSVRYINLVSYDDYCRVIGKSPKLEDGRAIVLSQDFDFERLDRLDFGNGFAYTLVAPGEGEDFDFCLDGALISIEPMTLVVPNFMELADELCRLDSSGYLEPTWSYYINTDLSKDAQIELSGELWDSLGGHHTGGYSLGSRATEEADFFSTFGGLFFLGIMLSLVFLCGAVLIIYYKQVSEGYEDAARFDIMQKVGMTKPDIRRSINSQLLIVFFAPLFFAVLHLSFAFPMIQKLLMLFSVANLKLLIVTAAISVLCFALIYVAVFRVTSNAYYSIVSGANSERE